MEAQAAPVGSCLGFFGGGYVFIIFLSKESLTCHILRDIKIEMCFKKYFYHIKNSPRNICNIDFEAEKHKKW
jgi:hypothetical protein